jgi:VWFA-related protein
MLSRRRLLAMLSAFPAARLLTGQETPQNATFSTGVNVVNLFATVRDNDGRIPSDLTKEDFVLQEDGRPQTIRYFSRETDLPLTLGLLVDTSMSQRHVLPEERSASYTFFEHVLREDKDQAFVLHFDREVELLQDLTFSRLKLEKALLSLDTPMAHQQPGGSGYPGAGGWRQFVGTQLYDAVLLASDELMRKQKGRKALVLLSDGVDFGSKVGISEAIEAAQRSDSLVYSIFFGESGDRPGNFGGLGGPRMGRRGGGMPRRQGERPDGKKILQRISKETGGSFFEVTKAQPIVKIYERVQQEVRNQYSLGYTSDRPNSESGYRRIALIANKKGLIVQTREGYYPTQAAAGGQPH